ncbi:hypothetical protein HNP84_008162 [Thermocatellispora tengchongensis]|uniref:DUF1963 domain-containing protein n=1 Tax=Thermocatellispora tengchongensis TaxID=1073253 RepID=A0A840PFQ5_9ACTN|nr:hypothetical protein [Thermocatellispora tengchongensis]MBB5138408.1 hypothetical protein [Thermocatellispora tengchongensis]
MTRTTPAPPVDVTAVFPWMTGYARTAVRLHPRPGAPGVHDSHIGGPLLWPEDEVWPTCARPLGRGRGPQDPPIPMAGVAQFFARDIPEIPFPDGRDLLQVLWCPAVHVQDDIWGPAIRLIWRRTAEIPEPSGRGPAVAADSWAALPVEEDYLPRPCVLHPERVTEYPFHQELPRDHMRALRRWRDETGARYQYLLSIAPGCKIGGWETWHSTDMYELPCEVCGTETEPLLQLDSTEWDGGTGPRWRPLEDRHLAHGSPAYRDACEPTSLTLGRCGSLTVFVCPADAEHGIRLSIQ